VVWHSEQRLEQVEGLLAFSDQQVDANELVLSVGAVVGVSRGGQERQRPLSVKNGLIAPTEIGQHDAEQGVELGIARLRRELSLERATGGLGVRSGLLLLTPKGVDNTYARP
jgi:hypothetical protein